MSEKFKNNPEIMELEIPPESLFLDWRSSKRVIICTHGLYKGGIGIKALSGSMKSVNAKKLIEEYEARYKRGEKIYKLINPIEKIDLKN